MNKISKQSKATEQAIKDWYCSVSGTCTLNPNTYGHWDARLTTPSQRYLIEIKGRNYPKSTLERWGTVRCVSGKLDNLVRLGYPIILAVTSNDGWLLEVDIDNKLPYSKSTQHLEDVRDGEIRDVVNYEIPVAGGRWHRVQERFEVCRGWHQV